MADPRSLSGDDILRSLDSGDLATADGDSILRQLDAPAPATGGAPPSEATTADGDTLLAALDRAPPAHQRSPEAFAKRIAVPGTSAELHPTELNSIASRNRVDPSWLKEVAPYFRMMPVSDEDVREDRFFRGELKDVPKFAAGVAVGAPTLDTVQGLAKKFGGFSEEQRRALDDLMELADHKRTTLAKVGGAVATIAAPAAIVGRFGAAAGAARAGSAAARATGAAAEAASLASKAKMLTAAEVATLGATGGIEGYAGSNEDDELRDTIFGTVFGLGAGVAIEGAKWLGRTLSKKGAEILADSVAESVGDIHTATKAAREAETGADDVLRRVLSEGDSRHAARTLTGAREVVQKLDDGAKAELSRLIPEGAEKSDDAIATLLVDSTKRLDRAVGKESEVAGRKVGDFAAEEGDDFFQKTLDRTFDERRAEKELLKRLDEPMRNDLRPGWFSKIVAVMSDARQVTDALDARYGTRLTPALDDASGAYHRYLQDAAAVTESSRHLVRETAKLSKKDPTFNLYQALEESPTIDSIPSKYSGEQRALIGAWRTTFDALRERAVELGLPIEKLGSRTAEGGADTASAARGYVPHYVVDPIEFALRVGRRGEALGLTQRTFAKGEPPKNTQVAADLIAKAKAGDGDAREFLDALGIGRTTEFTEPADVLAAFRAALDPTDASGRLVAFAKSAAQRSSGDGLPSFVLERDPAKLLQSWIQSTLSHAHMRNELATLQSQASSIAKAAPEGAAYIERLLRDVNGARRGLSGATSNVADRWELSWLRRAERAANAGDTAKATAYRILSAAPEVPKFMSAQMYPFFLGMRADAVVRNAFQPIVMTLPTIGYSKYGTIAMGEAAKRTALRVRDEKLSDIGRDLVRRGLAPPKQPFEASQWMRSGLVESRLAKANRVVLQPLNDIAMFGYTATDTATRVVTLELSKVLARDAMRGVPDALAIVRSVPHGYRARLADALREGNAKGVEDAIAAYLNGATMFNYNRISMSEFGRYMGGVFSMFSKWPSSIGGEIARQFDDARIGNQTHVDAMRKITLKYGAPVAVLAIGDALLAAGDVRDDVPASQLALGGTATSLMKAAPGAAVLPYITGRATPPVLAGVVDVVGPLTSGDVEKAADKAKDYLLSGTPFGTWYKFATEQLPLWFNQEPDK
jgi:hypothetical protein